MRPQRGSPATRPPGCLGWTCPLLGCSTRLRGGPTPLRSPRGAVLTPSSAHANTLSVRTVNAQAHSYIYACIMHTHMYMSRRRCHQLRQLPQHGARSALEPAHAPLPHQPEPAWDDRRDHVAARRAGRQHRAAGTRTHARAMQAHAGTCTPGPRHLHFHPCRRRRRSTPRAARSRTTSSTSRMLRVPRVPKAPRRRSRRCTGLKVWRYPADMHPPRIHHAHHASTLHPPCEHAALHRHEGTATTAPPARLTPPARPLRDTVHCAAPRRPCDRRACA